MLTYVLGLYWIPAHTVIDGHCFWIIIGYCVRSCLVRTFVPWTLLNGNFVPLLQVCGVISTSARLCCCVLPIQLVLLALRNAVLLWALLWVRYAAFRSDSVLFRSNVQATVNICPSEYKAVLVFFKLNAVYINSGGRLFETVFTQVWKPYTSAYSIPCLTSADCSEPYRIATQTSMYMSIFIVQSQHHSIWIAHS